MYIYREREREGERERLCVKERERERGRYKIAAGTHDVQILTDRVFLPETRDPRP